MFVQQHNFTDLDYAEELSERSLSTLTAPGDLVDRALVMNDRATSGIQMPWSKLSGLFTLRPGELVLLGGGSGHGKSAVANQLALHAVTQKKPDGEHYRAAIASLELPAEYVFHQMAQIAGTVKDPTEHWMRRVGHYLNERMVFVDRVDSMSPMEALQTAIGLRKFYGTDLFVLDGLMMIGLGDELEAQKIFTQKLAEVAKAFDICIVLICHMRKPSGGDNANRMPSAHDFLGSSNILNVASSALLVHRDMELMYKINQGDEVDPMLPHTRLVVAKQRYAPYLGVTTYWHHDNCRALCNSHSKQYRPIDIAAEDKWKRKPKSETEKPIWSQGVDPTGTTPVRQLRESTSETDSPTPMAQYPF
jgi:replicative DNA helicase